MNANRLIQNYWHRRQGISLAVVAALLLCVSVTGCGDRPSVVSETSDTHVRNSPTKTKPKPPVEPQSDDEETSASETGEALTSSTKSAQELKLPYPERTDPFLRPSPREAAAIVREAPKREAIADSPVLKGFFNVDGVGVMLMVEGRVWIARQGDERDDVRVVAINPPEVTLNRGETEWKLSLVPESSKEAEERQAARVRS